MKMYENVSVANHDGSAVRMNLIDLSICRKYRVIYRNPKQPDECISAHMMNAFLHTFPNNHLIGECSASNFPSECSGSSRMSERLNDVYKYKVLGHHTSTTRVKLHETIPYFLE